MVSRSDIRPLVEKALYFRQLTPDIERAINHELTRLGCLPDADFEALELLMDEMDAGRIKLGRGNAQPVRLGSLIDDAP